MNCKHCSKIIKKRNLFCDNKCQQDYIHSEFIKRWKAGLELGLRGKAEALSHHIKRYMVTKHDNKCEECGWNKVNQATGKVPLEVDHIDGNHKNNKEYNLRLLCPNCHSLTPTYKGANKSSRNRAKYKSRYTLKS